MVEANELSESHGIRSLRFKSQTQRNFGEVNRNGKRKKVIYHRRVRWKAGQTPRRPNCLP